MLLVLSGDKGMIRV